MQDNGLLMVVCERCENVLQVDKLSELKMLINDNFKCPDCRQVNYIPEELREYIMQSQV